MGTKPLQTSTSLSFTIFLCVCVLQLSVEPLFIEKDEDEGRKQKTPSVKNSKITILLLCHRAHFFTKVIYEMTQRQRLDKNKDSCLDLQLYSPSFRIGNIFFFVDVSKTKNV